MASSCVSSFSGKIMELPEISVDNFTDLTSTAYFLSHCHADHTQGLYSPKLLEHLQRDDVYIYMSEPSAAIVRHESAGSALHEHVRPLPLGVSVVPLPGNPLWDSSPHLVSVSLLPAGHCWGSVMLLFDTLYSCVLYSGDCRLTGSAGDYALLRDDAGHVLDVDTLYVDTTFCSPRYLEFPARARSVAAAHAHLHAWLERDGRYVALHTSARYGYEFVFNDIFDEFNMKVYVPEHAWQLYRQFPSQVRGVTADRASTRIHLCRNRSERGSHEACVGRRAGAGDRFLFVHYSALAWTDYRPDDDMARVKRDDAAYRIDVCFATHSSLSEIEHFVGTLKPRRVVGFPRPYRGGEAGARAPGDPRDGGARAAHKEGEGPPGEEDGSTILTQEEFRKMLCDDIVDTVD